MIDTERNRKRYLPKRVRLLLGGESRPASGKFFYCGDPMTTYTRRAFEHAYGLRPFADNSEFLAFFKEHGCYLEDISVTPVDAMSRADRKARLKACEVDLSRRIRKLNPKVIVAVLRRIEPFVRRAVAIARINPVIEVLPFAGLGHQNKYVTELPETVKRTLLSDSRASKRGRR